MIRHCKHFLLSRDSKIICNIVSELYYYHFETTPNIFIIFIKNIAKFQEKLRGS